MIRLALILPLVILTNCGPKEKEKPVIRIPDEVMILNSPKEQYKSWFNDCAKLVIFQSARSSWRNPLFEWVPYMQEYPSVRFIFIFVGDSEEQIQQWLTDRQLGGYPVLWDTNEAFLKDNGFEKEISFVSFFLNTKNEIGPLSNPTIPTFDPMMKKLQSDCD